MYLVVFASLGAAVPEPHFFVQDRFRISCLNWRIVFVEYCPCAAPVGPRRSCRTAPIRPFFSSSTILETWARWQQLERDFTISRAREYRKSDASLSVRGSRTMRTGSTTWMDSTMTKFKLLSVATILSTVILAFLTTFRPIAITAVDARAATLAHSLAEGCTARDPSQIFPCNCGKPNCL
jgi:hypothetical protein